MTTFMPIGQSQRDKETGEPDDATSITSGSAGGWEKRPAMDLARSLPSIIVARPTQSALLYQQMLGRGTRTYPGKTDCLVLDVVGVSTRHTLHTAATLFACDPARLALQSVLALLDRPVGLPQDGDLVTGTLRSTPVNLFAR